MTKKELYEMQELKEELESCKKLILKLFSLIRYNSDIRTNYNPRNNLTYVEITYCLNGKRIIKSVSHLSEVLENEIIGCSKEFAK